MLEIGLWKQTRGEVLVVAIIAKSDLRSQSWLTVIPVRHNDSNLCHLFSERLSKTDLLSGTKRQYDGLSLTYYIILKRVHQFCKAAADTLHHVKIRQLCQHIKPICQVYYMTQCAIKLIHWV